MASSSFSSLREGWGISPGVVVALLIFRIFCGLVVKTAFNPDEYWQSLEVAHYKVFGTGFMTWEWDHGLRGWAHILPFIWLYKGLKATGMVTPWSLAWGPRILQGCFAALTDIFSLCMIRRVTGGSRGSKGFLGTFARFLVASWFLGYANTRTLVNSAETCIASLAFALWPWNDVKAERRLECGLALAAAALATVVRPTHAIIWMSLGLLRAVRCWRASGRALVAAGRSPFSPLRFLRGPFATLMLDVGLVAALAISGMLVVDSWGYGQMVVVPLEFVKFNLTRGLAVLYGTHPWHWYLSQGLPANLGPDTIFFVIGVYAVVRGARYATRVSPSPEHSPETTDSGSVSEVEKEPGCRNSAANGAPVTCVLQEMLFVVLWTVGAMSLLAHKEFRFILPIQPLALVISAYGFKYTADLVSPRLHSLLSTVALIGQCGMFVFLGVLHQGGPHGVAVALRADAALRNPAAMTVDLLVPCHNTPAHTHLSWIGSRVYSPEDAPPHLSGVPVLRHTSCPPPGLPESILAPVSHPDALGLPRHPLETAWLERDPLAFLFHRYPAATAASFSPLKSLWTTSPLPPTCAWDTPREAVGTCIPAHQQFEELPTHFVVFDHHLTEEVEEALFSWGYDAIASPPHILFPKETMVVFSRPDTRRERVPGAPSPLPSDEELVNSIRAEYDEHVAAAAFSESAEEEL